ncbi:cytochrome P450 [Aspergillus tetrazonus]
MNFVNATSISWPKVSLASLSGLGLVVVVLIGLSVYRLTVHPYAKYPGPLLARLTSWYSIYHTYIGDLHTNIWECHEKYGDIVRYGPNRLLINTQPALKAIYGHGANVQKSKAYLRFSLVPDVYPTLATLDNARHSQLRRILNQGLSETHIRSMDAELRRIASLFAERLGEAEDRFESGATSPGPTENHDSDGWSAAKNMAEWCDFFTFDAMSQVVFGTSYHLLSSADNHWIIDCVLGQLRRISFLNQLRQLENMKLDKVLFPDARRKAFRFTGMSRQIMETRKDKMGNDAKNDLFGKLLAAKDPETGKALSHRQLWAESNTLIIAGSDTSSTGMAATFFYLSRNPSAYDRVANEVRSVFPTPDSVCQGPKLSFCVYLRACIQEALRLAPAVSGALWREVLPGGLKIRIEGDTETLDIPAGYEVGTGIWTINHNERYYPQPFSFRPERWIPEDSGEEAVQLAKAAFATFSIGPRNCVGKGLAMIEMTLAMAAVISRFDFRRADGAAGEVGEGKGSFDGQFQTFWAFTSFKDGPMIQFRPRKY